MMSSLNKSPRLKFSAHLKPDRRVCLVHAVRKRGHEQLHASKVNSGDDGQAKSASGASWHLAACALSCSAALLFAPSSLANPYVESKKTIILGVTAEGTIRGCLGNVNPNCVSTANTNELYAPAWRANTRDAKEAARVMEQTVLALYPDWTLAQSQSYDFGEYRAFLAPSLFGQDILEFLIKEDSVNSRNWEGDRQGPFVTYRSLAGSVKYIWPIQQPLSDFGAQKTRLQELREQLGWQVIGCELIECYEY